MNRSLLLIGGFVLTGCVEQSGSQGSVSNVPKLAANGLTPGTMANTQLVTDVLDGASAAAMGSDSDGRRVLAYAVGCALGPTESVEFTVDGVDYTSAGAMGIAPGWTEAPLSASEAAWVSACVISRVNLTGVSVAISDRGAATGLVTTATERSTYQVEEGAFWGNAFVDLGSIAAYSCNGVDQAADDTHGDLPDRECAQWDGVAGSDRSPCGMSYAGLCGDACTTTTGPYAGCSFLGGAATPAVVTTFLYGAP